MKCMKTRHIQYHLEQTGAREGRARVTSQNYCLVTDRPPKIWRLRSEIAHGAYVRQVSK